MGHIITAVLMQLVGQAPSLLVYLAGFVLALVYWQRYPGPCRFTLIANVVMLSVNVAHTFVIQYLFVKQAEFGWSSAKLGTIFSVVALTTSLAWAAGLGLLLAAVFSGRKIAPGATGAATQSAHRVSSTFFVSSVAGGLVLGVLFAVAGTLGAVSANDSSDPVPAGFLALLAVGFLLLFYAEIVFLVLLYKAWSCIQDGFARTTPGKAVGFLFIPFFNFYWLFQALPGFADDYNSYLHRANIPAAPMARGLLQALAILDVLSIIPIAGWFASLAALPVQCVVVTKICTAINALPETVAPPDPLLS